MGGTSWLVKKKLLIGQFCGDVVLLERGCKINEAIKSRENRDILEKLSLQGNNLQGGELGNM